MKETKMADLEDEDVDIVDCLRDAAKVCARPADDGGGESMPETADMFNEAADEIEALRRMLKSRDDFILSKGLFMEFANSLQ